MKTDYLKSFTKSIAFVSALIILLPATSLASEGLSIGDDAPNIVGFKLDGNIFKLYRAKSKLKVINFWHITCLPCKKELPELALLEKKYKQKATFASVHVELLDEYKIKDFIAKLDAAPKNIVITGGMIMEVYKFTSLPHTVVLDEKFKVVKVISGYTDANMAGLESFIKNY